MTNKNSNPDSENQPTESLQASDEMPDERSAVGPIIDGNRADNVQPSMESTAHPDIRDGNVSSGSPLKNFMKRVQQGYDNIPRAWGQMRTNSSRKEGL